MSQRVLLIGWDAADWKFINPLLDQGLMSNLESLVNRGAVGNLATLRPSLSPILWTSIATGKTADKHGVTGFVEPAPGGGVRLFSSTSRRTKAIWNILSQNRLRSIVIGWYASHPAEPILGTCVSSSFFDGPPADQRQPWDVAAGSVHPATLAPVISHLRVHPAELSRDDLRRMIPEIDQIDPGTDARPGKLAEALARTVSVHSVATGAMEAEPWDFLAVYYDALDVVGHLFMPFHPPRHPAVAERDFQRYQHVMRELYLFYDQMLGRLLQIAGDETTVILVSDHGFHSDHLRPANPQPSESEAATWHRHYGVLAMRGPRLIEDERIYGATLLDIAPTVLTLLDLPVGLDMDGRPLLQAFSDPPANLKTVSSWDQQPGDAGMHPAELQQAETESREAIAQLVALGYLPAETSESQKAAEIAAAESKFNLAIVHSSHGRSEQAMHLLEELHASNPESPRYALALAKVCANLQLHPRSREIVEGLEARGLRSAEGDLLIGAALFNEGRRDESLERLEQAQSLYPPNPRLLGLIGNVRLTQGDWPRAAAAFGDALRLDDDDPHAHNGLARAALQLGDHESAAEHALRAIGLLYFFPQAHYHLGMAFKGLGEPDRAIRSLGIAVTQSPGFRDAHAELARLYEQQNNVALFLRHQKLAAGMPASPQAPGSGSQE